MEPKPTLKIKRARGEALTIRHREGRYDIAITGGGNLTAEEMGKVADYIGDDPAGQGTLEKLRAR